MKTNLVLLVVGFLALTASSVVKEQRVADKAFLRIQRDVLLLLKNINQPSYYEEFVKIGHTYNISEHHTSYSEQSAVEEFLHYYHYGYLPRGHIFSVFYQDHLDEAIALIKLFYYAKDFETFYNTAVFARQNLNEGLFLYSFVVAVAHREDTKYVILPPIYEIYPYYFFSTEVIQQAYIYKQQYQEGHKVQEGSYNGYTINSNYSGYYLNLHPEQSLSYFLEDVGLNSFNYFYNIYNPFFLNGEEFGYHYFNRGEQYHFYYQQIIARFYMERISNGFGEIPFLSFDTPFETPYYPSLEYPNGLEFPARPQFADAHTYNFGGQSGSSSTEYFYSLFFIQDYERRINDAIDSGYVHNNDHEVDMYSREGFNMLGNIIQSNPDSPNNRYYGPLTNYARHLLGYSHLPLSSTKAVPSALEHFETERRDPAFYQLFKNILLTFQRYYSYIPPYTEEQLVFPGVHVESFTVDRLVTYDDYFYSDISNAVYYTPEEQQQSNFHVRVRQSRLNSKPFTYNINVQSEHATQAVVKVFFGPRYDQHGRYLNISENRLNHVLIDYFVYELKSGENIISRNSHDSQFYGSDATSFADLYQQVTEAYEGHQEFHYTKQNYYYYYPQRYILPRGSASGTPYQFYVIVYPYVPLQLPNYPYESEIPNFFSPYVGEHQFYDNYTLGYPFDRHIRHEQLFYQVPNSYFQEAIVYHQEDVNAVHSD